MFWNYLKIALRQLARNRIYSAINIIGFALGLAVSVIITLYVIDDLSFDSLHQKGDRIYRLITSDTTQDTNGMYAVTSGRLVKTVKDEIPEVVSSVRLFSFGNNILRAAPDGTADPDDPGLQIRGIVADSTFFSLFDFPVLQGDYAQMLHIPNTCIISRRAAERFFGNGNAIGQQVQFGRDLVYTVNGVFEDMPVNSHIHADMLVALEIMPGREDWWDHWSNVAGMGYVLLQDRVDKAAAERKIQALAAANGFGDDLYVPYLQPLRDIHLGSNNLSYDWINVNPGDKTRATMLGVIAGMVLLIASINFINLSSARAAKRAKEVGLRKVVGAERGQLARQFLGESILMTMLSMVIALIGVQLLMPLLPQIFDRAPVYTLMNTPILTLLMFVAAILVGLLSGVYPALVLTNFQPAAVLKGEFRAGKRGVSLRQFLVVSQFAISIALVVAVLVIIQQLDYLRNRNMGYNRDQVLTIPLWQVAGQRGYDTYNLLAEELKKVPGVESVGGTSHMPGWGMARFEVRPEGKQNVEKGLIFNRMYADDGFIPTLQIMVEQGRNISEGFGADFEHGIILNRTGARAIGWDDPLGRSISLVNADGSLEDREIVGVVDDFHFMTPRQSIEPLMFTYNPQFFSMLLVRIQAGTIPETVERIEGTFEELYPGNPFNSNFFDDVFDYQFRGDRQFARNVAIFAALAILIACLGLFGLASYATEQRRKEIAVRKVLGSSEGRLVTMLAWDFLKWVAIANIIAWPMGWFGLKRWLDEFTYKTSLTAEPFLLAGLGALLIALITVSFQSIRAARTNPATALRSEV